MLKYAGVMAIVMLVACVQQPQTRQEFRAAVSKGAFSAKAESFTVNRNFQQAVSKLSAKTKECFNKVVERHMSQGMYQEHTRSTYRASVQTPTAKRAEFTMQVLHNPRGVGADPPPGGFYMFVADLEAISPDSFRVDLYRPTLGHGDTVDAVRDWLNGKDNACPKLP
jgi:aspartate/methionine/tyrosine aminotransferase